MKQNYGQRVAQFLHDHRDWKALCSICCFICLHIFYGSGRGFAALHGLTWLWMACSSRGSRQFHIPLAILPFLQFTKPLIALFVFLEMFLLWCMYHAKRMESFAKNLYLEMSCYSYAIKLTMMYSNALMATVGAMLMGTNYLDFLGDDNLGHLPKSALHPRMKFLRTQTKEILHGISPWRSYTCVLSRIDACLCYQGKKRVRSYECEYNSICLLQIFVYNLFDFCIVSGTVPCDDATRFCVIAVTFLDYLLSNHQRTTKLLARNIDPTKQKKIVCRHKITAVERVFERREYLEANVILLPRSLRTLLADYDQEIVDTTPCALCFFLCETEFQ
jgi:hypothetical protein